ncbi:MAG: chloride channel protein, partial [Acidimicrobiales bacterium]
MASEAGRPGGETAAGPGIDSETGFADGYVGPDERSRESTEIELGDFTTDHTIWRLVALSLVVGAIAAVAALALLDLISLVSNGLYYGKGSTALRSPKSNTLGWWAVVIPIAGGLAVGGMAYFGSERIRGHGIPEAMETILVGGSKVEPRLLFLKPTSSAISIGTGGPFGAEGPIILTGGAIGSVLAQMFRLAAIERRVLLVGGACAGMAAVFGTPVAAVIFGVELLLFELRPRSLVPCAGAVVVAAIIRDEFASRGWLPSEPLFPVGAHIGSHGATLISSGSLQVGEAVAIGLLGGGLAWVLTKAVYGAEDMFRRLPVHWAWWPAIGGVVVGVAGVIDRRVLGVGYDTIRTELAGKLAISALLILLVLKLVAWSVALGSGTSGGVLAPLLMMGAALGGVVGHYFVGGSPGEWALVGMAATLAGATRIPITAVVFSFELTRAPGAFLPLLAACATAHLVSVLLLKRSILTEKVARRGFHVMREYQVDPLDAVFVREVSSSEVFTAPPDALVSVVLGALRSDPQWKRQRLVPVTEGSLLLGIVTRSDLEVCEQDGEIVEVMRSDVVVAHPDETLRSSAERMATHEITAMPVVDVSDSTKLIGIVTEMDLLVGRQRQLVEERQRERPLRLWSLRRRNGNGSGSGSGGSGGARGGVSNGSVADAAAGAGSGSGSGAGS